MERKKRSEELMVVEGRSIAGEEKEEVGEVKEVEEAEEKRFKSQCVGGRMAEPGCRTPSG